MERSLLRISRGPKHTCRLHAGVRRRSRHGRWWGWGRGCGAHRPRPAPLPILRISHRKQRASATVTKCPRAQKGGFTPARRRYQKNNTAASVTKKMPQRMSQSSMSCPAVRVRITGAVREHSGAARSTHCAESSSKSAKFAQQIAALGSLQNLHPRFKSGRRLQFLLIEMRDAAVEWRPFFCTLTAPLTIANPLQSTQRNVVGASGFEPLTPAV